MIGGIGSKIPDSQFNRKQLNVGTMHEFEHTDTLSIAKAIAKDHLAEDPLYYVKLKKIEHMKRG